MTDDEFRPPDPPRDRKPRFPWLGVSAAVAAAAIIAAVGVTSLARSRVVANQNNAAAMLHFLVDQEAKWRQEDADRNGLADYWTRDVAAFHCVHGPDGKPIAWIPLATAAADRVPGMAYPELASGVAPRQGYWFQAMTVDQDGAPYLQAGLPFPKAGNAPSGACTHKERFGIAAFPDRYPAEGSYAMIVNEDGTVWVKDAGRPGPVLNRMEARPEGMTSGWSQM